MPRKRRTRENPMPDISMCNGAGCPLRLKCYRHRAIPTPGWQSWMNFHYDPEAKKCDAFWDIKGRGNLRTEEECARVDD